MASHVSNYLFTGSRGRILIGATLLFFLVIFVSFRARITGSEAWHSALGGYNDPVQISVPEADLHTSDPPFSQHAASSSSSSPPPPSANGGSQKDNIDGAQKDNVKVSTEPVQPAPPALQQLKTDDCQGFPDTSDVLVIMKTGATEAYEKLPIHFMSTLKCVEDFVLFSDMEMNMAGFHVSDVLSDLSPEYIQGNGDFDLYRTLKEFEKEHQDPRDLKQGMNGWNLDKYKFVPMLKRAWDHRQDASWYVFMEADSFVEWENLMRFLRTFNAKEPHYIGSPTYLDIQFAHGGTGYVISGGAMQKAVGQHPDLVEKYGREAEEYCCGDRMTAAILIAEGVHLTTAWPMFNGEKPLTLAFGQSQWCQPVMTMHHLTAQEVSKAWNFQMRRKRKGERSPMVWKDVFDYFVHDNLRAIREDWENLSSDASFTPDQEGDFHGRKWSELTDAERSSPESPEKCKALCQSEETCLQWEHHGSECCINYSIKLGKARPASGKERWISGWNLVRVQKFLADMKGCPEADWTYHPPA